MNYKHAYHAGNFADVVKHILLLQLLQHLSLKQKPFYVLDAYGGRGLYSLASAQAQKTQEKSGGIDALLSADNTDAPPIVQQFLQNLAMARCMYDNNVYPGSPWWIAQFAQHQSFEIVAESFEKSPEEYEALHYQLYQMPIGIHHRDAYEGVLAVLPPKQRRGLIFIDPPFEQEHKDFSQLVELLSAAYKKFATGVFVLWYPLKNKDAVQLFYKKMQRTGIKKQLICELNIYPNDIGVGLNGTGLLVINPPFGFDKIATQILQYLAPILTPKNAPSMPSNQKVIVRTLVGEK